jgi:hypothetical protein
MQRWKEIRTRVQKMVSLKRTPFIHHYRCPSTSYIYVISCRIGISLSQDANASRNAMYKQETICIEQSPSVQLTKGVAVLNPCPLCTSAANIIQRNDERRRCSSTKGTRKIYSRDGGGVFRKRMMKQGHPSSSSEPEQKLLGMHERQHPVKTKDKN